MVVSNNPGAYALERARQAGVPGAVITRKEFPVQADFERQLQSVLELGGIDMIVLAGFMCILSGDFTRNGPVGF